MSRSFKKHGYSVIGSPYGSKKDRTIYHRSDRRQTKLLLKEIIKEDDFDNDEQFECGCPHCWLLLSGYEVIIPYEKYVIGGRAINTDEEYCPYTCKPKVMRNKIPAIDKVLTKGKNYSASYADKWSWDTDGGSHFRDDLLTIRKEFDEDVFGISGPYYYSGKPIIYDIWQDYCNCIKRFTNSQKSTWQITVQKTEYVFRRLHWGDEGFQWGTGYIQRGIVAETKEITVEIPYKKHLKAKDIPVKDWDKIVRCYHQTNLDYGFINSNILYRLFDWGKIPFTFKKSEELIKWLRDHEEKIIRTYYRYYYKK